MHNSKERLTKLCKIVAFTTIAIGSIGVLGAVVKPKSTIEYPNSRNYNTYQIFKEPDNSIDVAIMGHSHVYSGISPMEMYKKTGITSYDCSRSVQMPEESYEFLTQMLTKHTPNVVVFEVGQLFYYRTKGFGLISQYLEIEHYSPIFQNHILWKSLLPGENYTERDVAKGYMEDKATMAYKGDDVMEETDDVYTIDDNYIEIMDKMKDLCQQHGINFMLLKIPTNHRWDYAKSVAVKEYAESRNLNFVDLNLIKDELDINWLKDTCDGGDHLNYIGAEKVSKWLAQYLKDRYALQDRREDPKYISWQEDYKKYYGLI